MLPPSQLNTIGTGALGYGFGQYPDPFNTVASQTMPRSIAEALRWCERSVTVDITMAQALQRVASYFVTDVEVTSGTTGGKVAPRADKEQFEEFLHSNLRIRSTLVRIAYELLVYGIVFNSLEVPFRRLLSCQMCRSLTMPMSRVVDTPEMKFKYDAAKVHFMATCPACGNRSPWKVVDRYKGAESSCRVQIWSVHDMEINYHTQSGDQQYIWNVPERERRLIRDGRAFHLERTPIEVLHAVASSGKILFDDGYIHKMCLPWLSGVDSAGWGMGRPLMAYRQSWYNQALSRINESIGLDHTAPLRVVTPDSRPGEGGASSDPLAGHSMALWRGQVSRMLRAHKRDPNGWHTLPFPVRYQMLGGDANNLAPFQLMDHGIDVLLNGIGIPAEMYKGTLSFQSAYPAARLFESHWMILVDSLNGFLEWLSDRIYRQFRWAPMSCRLSRVTHADDMNRIMAVLQLFMGRQISGTTAMRLLGENWEQEQVRMLEEQQFVADKSQEVQDVAQKAQAQKGLVQSQDPAMATLSGGQGQGQGQDQGQGQGQAAPGGPAPGGPVAPTADPATGAMGIEDFDSQARDLASQLNQMPSVERKRQLSAIRRQNSTLHHLVTAYMEEERRGWASQGRQQGAEAAQQAGQGQG